MMETHKFLSSVIILLFLTFGNIRSQVHRLKVVGAGKNTVGPWPSTALSSDAPTTEAQRKDTGQRFNSAANVCAYGMWALYNQTNYGESLESSTAVVSVRGFEAGGTCASSTTYPIFKSVKSARFLGNMNPAAGGMDIFSEPNFLGADIKITMAGGPSPIGGTGMVNAIKLGSLAITSGATGMWRLCPDMACANNVMCIDMSKQRGGLFLIRDVQRDTSTVGWPIFVRGYAYIANPAAADIQQCENNDFNPATPVATLRSEVDDDVLEII